MGTANKNPELPGRLHTGEIVDGPSDNGLTVDPKMGSGGSRNIKSRRGVQGGTPAMRGVSVNHDNSNLGKNEETVGGHKGPAAQGPGKVIR
jgi:hypothetical protein